MEAQSLGYCRIGLVAKLGDERERENERPREEKIERQRGMNEILPLSALNGEGRRGEVMRGTKIDRGLEGR